MIEKYKLLGFVKVYFNLKMLVILLLGIASGLPLTLSAATLSLMLVESGFDLAKVSFFALASTPYTLKYLWSPLVDNFKIPLLYQLFGLRRSWFFASQILLAVSMVVVGLAGADHENIILLGASVLCLSFFSATQDIIIDAYRIEVLKEEEQAAGAAMATFGYRIGMLISSAGALFISEYIGWPKAYALLTFFLLPAGIAVFLYGEPQVIRNTAQFSGLAAWIRTAFVAPFLDFATQKSWFVMLLLIVFYKLSDAYIGSLTSYFFVQMGFSKIEIAWVIKICGFAAAMLGAIIGGQILAKYKNIYNILLIGLFLQQLSNLSFLAQLFYGHSIPVLVSVIALENVCSGISNVALIAYIGVIINTKFTATHYALLTALASFGRTVLCASAGGVAAAVGWANFFLISAIISLPAFGCLYYLYYRRMRAGML